MLTNLVIGDADVDRVLLVDDEEAVRESLARYLGRRGYLVETAASAGEALTHLGNQRYTLMVCDIRMPDMSGLQLVPEARRVDPDLAIVMLSALADAPSAAEALRLGAMDYLAKPLELEKVRHALERAIRRRRLLLEQRNVERLLQAESARLTREHAREVESLADGVVHALVRVTELLEAREAGHAGRMRRLAAVAEAVAVAIGLSPHRAWQIRSAAQLSDIGVLVGPRGSRGSTGSTQRALDILSGLTSLPDLVEGVRDQGEFWDGSGGPRRARGDDISLGGRVLAAARAFTELTAPRTATPPLSTEEAAARVSREAGTRFDPGVCDALTRVIRERRLLGFDADVLESQAPRD
ncbi:MAG: response regulator [Gemmatimonadaceae bacterium]|nr:response regulator [Gemmatimonadaceae bacterium]